MAIRIAYDYQIFVAQRYGGVSRYFVELATRIKMSEGLDARIFAPGYINKYLEEVPDPRLVIGSARPNLPKTIRVTATADALAINLWARRYLPDILHETYYSPSGLRSKRAKLVITVYDFVDEKYGFFHKGSSLTSKNKHDAIRRADHIICISENTKNDLLERIDVSAEKISVIHLSNSLQLGEKINFPQIISPFILYVGIRSAYKNFARCLTAYATSSSLNKDFALVCFGGGAFTPAEQESIIALGLSKDQVIQIGGDDKILANLYDQAACLSYPSLYEGFGIPLLEAMSLNCPVVCSNVTSIPEVVGGAAEMFDPESVDDIQGALERTVTSTETSQKLRVLGRERARQFSWDRCAWETGQVYRALLSG